MKFFVILLNCSLITLILYNLLSKTDSIIENLEGCPADKKNAIYRQKALLDRLFSELQTLKTEVDNMDTNVKSNKRKIKSNSQNAKAVSSDIDDEKNKKMDELNDIS